MAGPPGPSSATEEVESRRKRKRKSDQHHSDSVTCNQPGAPQQPPDRASAEPEVPDQQVKTRARTQEADSGAQGDYADTDLALVVDLPPELAADSGTAEAAAAAAAAASFLPLDGELEHLPIAVDPVVTGAKPEAGGAMGPAARPAVGAGASIAAVDRPGAATSIVEELPLAGPQAADGLPPAPSKQDSALLPQCAVMTGAALEPPEVSTREHEPEQDQPMAPEPLPRQPSQQYLAVKEELASSIIQPEQAGVSWERFPNYLGEGVASRLLALATLHLTAAGAAAPAAVKELPANSNRALLGAALNCELYQERVVRALAHKVQTPLIVADVYNLKLDDVLREEGPPGLDEPYGSGGAFPPDSWEASDEDEAFPGLPKVGKKDNALKDTALETAMALRAKTAARRGIPGLPGKVTVWSTNVPSARPPPPGSLTAATVEAAAAAPFYPATSGTAAEKPKERMDESKRAAEAHANGVWLGGVWFPSPGIEHAAGSAPAPEAAGPTLQARQAAILAAADAAVARSIANRPVAVDQQQQTTKPEEKEGAGAAVPASAPPASQQPAAAQVASGSAAPQQLCQSLTAALGGIATLDTAKLAALASRPPTLVPTATATPALQPGTPAAASKSTTPPLRCGDRVSYLGRLHPSLVAAQERLDQLQAAIKRVEACGSQRYQEYLPQLMVRRSLVSAQSQRVPRVQGSNAPPIGSKGRVVTVAGDKVQVVFDEPFTGGTILAGSKKPCGFSCTADNLQVIEDKEDLLVSSLQALFDVIQERAEEGPLIVLIQNLDRLLRGNSMDHFRKLEALLASLPQRCLLFAGYCTRSLSRIEAKREGGPPNLSRFFGSLNGGDNGMGSSSLGASDDLAVLDRFGRGPGRAQRKSGKSKLLCKMLPNHVELHPPNQEVHAKDWKKMVEADVATMRQHGNRIALRKALSRCGCECDDLDAVSITECQLARKEIEQLVGVAVAQQVAAEGPPPQGVEADGAKQAANEATGAVAEAAVPTEAGSAAAAAPERAGSMGAIVASPALPEEQPSAAVAAEIREQQTAAPAEQPCAMQTDNAEAGAAAAGQAAGAPAVSMAADVPGPADDCAVADSPAAALETAEKPGPPWPVRASHLIAAAEAIRKMQAEAAAQPDRHGLKDVAVDQYEKQLLSEVIPPEEINVSFDDIGALDTVKSTLHEVVILPLQRPELFTRGALTKPTKGLLLFGPPGTGKTMLAKAVASESGAHFINVNMSAITSKWFGEGERLVRALFGLAHKLSPSVIFVDEIDSFLSKRGQSNSEHEALRKMKNEFMTHWDGLRTKQSDRVLVLAATNRPMDLDDAVIRRMPRRIFVPLPDAANRERILRVILKDEHLDPAFDFKEAASLADGYSGSDLKNLCIAAAYCPIREFLEKERAAAKEAGKTAAAAAGASSRGLGAGPQALPAAAAAASSSIPAALAAVSAATVASEPVPLRQINLADFREALKQVTASTHSDSATMNDLKRWNDQYGEGGSRCKEVLAYFM